MIYHLYAEITIKKINTHAFTVEMDRIKWTAKYKG